MTARGRMVSGAMVSSARTGTGRDDWCTPTVVLDLVRKVGPIYLDPCWNANASTKPNVAYSEDGDGLSRFWSAPPGSLVFVNPPYSDIRTWLGRCNYEWEQGRNDCTIALVPARTDTRAWHGCDPSAICFWKGRLTFVGAAAPAPFPSALLCWAKGEMRDRFLRVFEKVGMVVARSEAW